MRKYAVILSAVLGILVQGCTVSGFALGAIADGRIPQDTLTITGWEEPTSKNQRLVIELRSGTVYQGQFVRFDREDQTVVLQSPEREEVAMPAEAVVTTTFLPAKRNTKWIGLVAGAFIDMIALLWLSQAFT